MRNVGHFDWRSPAVVAAGLCVGLACAPDWVIGNLALDRTSAGAGELWRLWSGHIVHFSLRHALFDAGAVLLFGRAAEALLGKRLVALTLLLALPLISIALLTSVPDMREYRGASGLATILGTLAGAALWRSRPDHRGFLAFLSILFVAKIACDAWGPQTTLAALPLDVYVAWQAHLLSIAAAVAALSLADRDRGRAIAGLAIRTSDSCG